MQETPLKKSAPRFCVFCGIALPAGENVSRCPGCAEVIPEQFRLNRREPGYFMPPANIDTSMAYCIYCGEFIDKTSKRTGKCSRCFKELPRAPPTEH